MQRLRTPRKHARTPRKNAIRHSGMAWHSRTPSKNARTPRKNATSERQAFLHGIPERQALAASLLNAFNKWLHGWLNSFENDYMEDDYVEIKILIENDYMDG